MITRTQIQIQGLVQGVGFRPFVFSLATRRSLRGNVCNNEAGVLIDVEGDSRMIKQFVDDLRLSPPPLSTIDSIVLNDLPAPANFSDFRITASQTNGSKSLAVSADVGTCQDCLNELFDPEDRRYRYAFINCTNCGPRFTIVQSVPYDRARTTMRDFIMCEACRNEYEDPANRRFHAEPTACAICGPRVFLRDGLKDIEGDPIDRARELLLNGKIVAIKGLGGFHLACDATNEIAVESLRQRKYREDKPFALMANSIEIVKPHAEVSDAEERLLASARRPIVLLRKKAETNLAPAIAPGVNTVGFMLPYTPLHYLLLENLDRPLVMTSGNVSDEPICYRDEDADRLVGIADYYLLHDRRIQMRTDDSVVRIVAQRPYVLRRSRGYAPAPIKTAIKFKKQILACGAELKNTFCLAKGEHAFVSHHIGDLENLETLSSFTQGFEHFKGLFELEPEVVAYDFHPEYLSTKYALALDTIDTKVAVQHHHAHIASCMTDNCADGDVIGVAMDGLGFGTDGCLWGGEFLVASFQTAERVAHLEYVPMPGGAKAIREPWRMAAVYLHHALGDQFLDLNLPFVKDLKPADWMTLRSMTTSKTNSPETSSMGRLFDAVSSLLCLRRTVNYEGQAAIELETILDEKASGAYEFEMEADGLIKAEKVIRAIVDDLLDGRSAAEVSARFHQAVANLIVEQANKIGRERGLSRVALSGGVFQNMFLLSEVCGELRKRDFEVLTHSRVPTNDGGISLGQAAVANAQVISGGV